MTFPSLQSATEYLQQTLTGFFNQRNILTERLRAIARLKEAALKSNNQQAIGQLIVMRQQTVALLNEYFLLEDKVKPYAQYFGFTVPNPQTLGALPLILAGTAIALASSLYLYSEKLKHQGRALDLVAKGILPADQAESILNPSLFSGIGGSFASVGLFAVGGLFLFLFMMRKS